MSTIMLNIDGRGVAAVTLNRPNVHNAFDDSLIATLTDTLRAVDNDPAATVVELRAAGRSFCAGADLNWMQRVAGYTEAENLDDARRLASLLRTLAGMRKPTIAVVQGAAFGGGVGLVSCCDIAIASERATFSLSEVKLGLIPATISPFVVRAIGERACRRYFLTGERFDATTAKSLGLVHEVVAEAALDTRVATLSETLAGYGAATLAANKALLDAVANRPLDDALMEDAATRIARQRVSPEGREGVNAFLDKRPPQWPRDD